MFHHITDQPVSDMPDSCVCKVNAFSSIINSFINNNVRFLTPYDIVDGKYDKGVMITFDDITDDVYYNAFPTLIKYNIPFTIFVTAGLIDCPPYISKSHLLEMASSQLCTIGSHTMTHPNLRKSQNVEYEIIESKKFLQDLTQKDVDFFAYPYGKHSSVSKRVINIVKNSGYLAAFGTIETSINSRSIYARYYFPRLVENN